MALRVPYFESARRIVAETDSIATIPASLIDPAPGRRKSALVSLKPPLPVPGMVLQALSHRRHDDDPLHRWLRQLLQSIAAERG